MEQGHATLTGWGRVRRAASATLLPASAAELGAAFTVPQAGTGRGLIAHAAGRSYGDAALNGDGHAVLTGGLSRILSFDAETGAIEAEPGVTFGQLLSTFLPLGYLVPVTPGTGFATLGGAVAHDVHGKNHERYGSFGQHVTELDLLTPDGTLRTLSPTREPDMFAATIGGLGLTGIVTRVAFRMSRVAGPGVQVSLTRLPDLDAFLHAMDAAAGATYAVGWIDGTARGRALGRGVLELAEPSAAAIAGRRPRPRLRVPVDLPAGVLNPLTVRLFNAAYWRRVPATGAVRHLPYDSFLYPLDALHDWNRIYGRRGFHQFQNVLPFNTGPAVLAKLLEVIAASGRASFLAVLKRLGPGRPGAPRGLLSFPRPGYTLALDFPAGPGIEELYARLVAITREGGGRVYLAKDALLSPGDFREMYPDWTKFRDLLDQLDPDWRLQSDLSRRLRLRDAA